MKNLTAREIANLLYRIDIDTAVKNNGVPQPKFNEEFYLGQIRRWSGDLIRIAIPGQGRTGAHRYEKEAPFRAIVLNKLSLAGFSGPSLVQLFDANGEWDVSNVDVWDMAKDSIFNQEFEGIYTLVIPLRHGSQCGAAFIFTSNPPSDDFKGMTKVPAGFYISDAIITVNLNKAFEPLRDIKLQNEFGLTPAMTKGN